MATHIELSTIRALPLTPYSEIRRVLKSGDLLFAAGNYPVSKAIQKVTDSPWSHVGIVFRLDVIDRMLLLESVEPVGVRFAPLSKYLHDYSDGKPYRGEVVLARCGSVDPSMVNELARSGIDELTRPYDNDEIAKIVARIALGMGKKKRDREYICSELVYECFLRAGREFVYDRRGFISPETIWEDPKVSLVGRIH